MNLQAGRRRLRSAGHDESAIEEMIDRLADEQVQEEKDRAIEETSGLWKLQATTWRR